MKTIISALLLVLMSSSAMATDPWSKTDVALGTTAMTLNVVDWRQTVYIARNPERYDEAVNWMLPKHPSQDQVHLYFALRAAVVLTAAHYSPSWLRKSILVGASTISVVCIEKNLGVGISVRW